jgi:hypothetical protein
MLKNNIQAYHSHKSEELASTIFNISNNNKKVDEKKESKLVQGASFLLDVFFNRLERICIILLSDYLNEEDAALLFRLPDPNGKGKETIRNYALRSKKLSFAKAGREGLLLNRKDLNKLYEDLRTEKLNL